MANLIFKNKAGQEVELTGVNGLRAKKSDGTNIDYIHPEGKATITGTTEIDVSDKATAQVVDANLQPGNIKKDITILGVTGTFEGGGPSSDKYVTFTATQANSSVKIEMKGSLSPIELYYSTDNTTWQAYTIGTVINLTNVGDFVSFYGVGNWRATYSSSAYLHFVMTGKIAGSGNCNSLLDAYTNATVEYCCFYMFEGCTSLVQAPELHATMFTAYCYAYMFKGCTSLVQAPELPGTTLYALCYYGMFQGCTSLTQAPELPATTLANSCYGWMFNGCTSLVTAPELPATTMQNQCYTYMFEGCTSLAQAPELPATTLHDQCYNHMFYGCTSLTQAPELPATTLTSNCYNYMFYGCTSLTQAPELPATTMQNQCYNHMFYGCTSLTQAPELPATTLASYCYQGIFQGCTSLTQAPELPATTLTSNCYNHMFYGCTSLTQAPELPATTLASYCYQGIFQGCSKITSVKTAVLSWNTSYAQAWLTGVAATGTVYCPHDSTIPSNNTSGIPSGWTRVDWEPAA